MLDQTRRALGTLLLLAGMLTSGPAAAPIVSGTPDPARGCQRTRGQLVSSPASARPFARTELYFGAATRDGVVAEEQFREFVDQHVSPLFPGGLTVLKAEGRFRAKDDVVVKEPSFVLVVLYPCQALADGSRHVDRIRTLYKERFVQHSVLRVDDPQIVWVSY
jgi:Protein of unknown function (DUF3574)